jgi:hypothetical protein
MNAHERGQSPEQETGLPLQFKILLAIIIGGVLFLLLQVIGVL